MEEVWQEIKEDQYNRYIRMTYPDFSDEIAKIVPNVRQCGVQGYHWYGCRLVCIDQKFYIVHLIGGDI